MMNGQTVNGAKRAASVNGSVLTENGSRGLLTKRIRLVLVDDLSLVRQGIEALLSAVKDLELVGQGATADDAVGLSRGLSPDVILMDQDLPGNSFLAIRTIREILPQIEIIIMTRRLDDAKALQAVEAGATGYVLKDIPARDSYMYFYGKNTLTVIFTMLQTLPYYFRITIFPYGMLYHYSNYLPYQDSFFNFIVLFAVVFMIVILTAGFYLLKKLPDYEST